MKKKLRARDLPYDGIREDMRRRFRNAVLSLALSNPRWMLWVEENLPQRVEDVDRTALVLVESLARFCILRNYSFFGRERIGWLLFQEWALNDDGGLTPG